MFPSIDTRQPIDVEIAIQRLYQEMFPSGDKAIVSKSFDWALACFTGRHPNYQAIDAKYHDLEHTLQVTLCLVRLMHGWIKAGGQPVITHRMFELTFLAILFHDTGYLKTRDDTQGTGAKYTLTHVNRSAEFAAAFLANKGYSAAEIQSMQNMIHCTGVVVNLAAVPFGDELERLLGLALGTADYLGQMAADDYIEPVPEKPFSKHA